MVIAKINRNYIILLRTLLRIMAIINCRIYTILLTTFKSIVISLFAFKLLRPTFTACHQQKFFSGIFKFPFTLPGKRIRINFG